MPPPISVKPFRAPILPEMERFRVLVKAKGWTQLELRDLLRDGVMSQHPPSLGSVRKWMLGISNPRAEKLESIRVFLQTFAPNGIKVPSVKTKNRTKQTNYEIKDA